MDEAELMRIRETLDEGPNLPQMLQTTRTSPRSLFEHTPLADPEHEIRLFKLQTTAGHDNIKLELELRSWNLAECPAYSAISYVWGNRKECRVINVNGDAFHTMTNGFYALLQVANQYDYGHAEDSVEYLWMDSICIDQDNLDEKGKQVYLMGNIYERAVDVFACVGPHADDSALVLEVFQHASINSSVADICLARQHSKFNEYNAAIDEMWKKLANAISMKWETSLARTSGISLHTFWSSFSSAVLDFFNRPYWHRMWIVQETWLAKDVYILCGPDILNICYLGPCFTRDCLLNRPWASPWVHSKMFAVLVNSHHTGSYKRGVRLVGMDAFNNLSDSKCADFGDRVYALLRVIQWSSQRIPQWSSQRVSSSDINIRPDYRITELGLMRQVANDLAVPWVAYQDGSRLASATLWGTLSSLYRAMPLNIDSPEILELLEQRKESYEVAAQANREDERPSSQKLMLQCSALHGVRLKSCADGFTLPASCRLTSSTKLGLSETSVLESHHRRLTIEGKVVGWTSPKVLSGDILISGIVTDIDPVCTPYLIIRSFGYGFLASTQIISHAVLFHGYSATQEEDYTQNFDIDDFITHVVFRTHFQSGVDTVTAIDSFLRTSPTRTAYWSWGDAKPVNQPKPVERRRRSKRFEKPRNLFDYVSLPDAK